MILYKTIYDFKLIFKFKYNILTKDLTAEYIPYSLRWLNQMQFFQFYLKLLTKFKWYQLPQKQLINYLIKAKRSCYLSLINQNKKK